MDSGLHPLLAEQLKQYVGVDAAAQPQLQALLAQVSATYTSLEASKKDADDTAARRTGQLIASTSHAYSFLDSIHKGFIMCDTSAEVVLTNQSVRRILSLKQASLDTPANVTAILTNWSIDAISELLAPEVNLKAEVKECLVAGQTKEFETINFGRRVIRLSVAPLQSSNGVAGQSLGVIVLVEDISEQKILERSKDEFLSLASHELRTPLTAIRGNTFLIQKYYKDSIANADMAEMITDIHDSAVRLIDIVNDFLDVSSLEQGKFSIQPANFMLNDVVHEVVRELKHLCDDKGVTLQADDTMAESLQVYADQQRIKQVLINLIGNAIRFTEKGSITIGAHPENGMVTTFVTDTGRGMDETNQKMLFHKFQQAGSSLLTRDTTKGTGLGLYICKLIVERSGGTIGLQYSEPVRGSCFYFSLPTSAH